MNIEKIYESLGRIENNIEIINKRLDLQEHKISKLDEKFDDVNLRTTITENTVKDICEKLQIITEKQVIINGCFKEKQKLFDLINFTIRNPKKFFIVILILLFTSSAGTSIYIFITKILEKLDVILKIVEQTK